MTVARRPKVRWNEGKQRWMAWVRFPDGSRQKVERVDKADAEKDLKDLLAERAQAGSAGPRRLRLATFGEVMDAWVDAGCPKAAVSKNSRRAKPKSPNTLTTIGYLFDGHVRPQIGGLRVDRTQTPRVEQVFAVMADGGYATSTIDHALDVPEPGSAVRAAAGDGQDQPGGGRVVAGGAAGAQAQVVHVARGRGADALGDPAGSAAGVVDDWADGGIASG
jgi:hypothetical protein